MQPQISTDFTVKTEEEEVPLSWGWWQGDEGCCCSKRDLHEVWETKLSHESGRTSQREWLQTIISADDDEEPILSWNEIFFTTQTLSRQQENFHDCNESTQTERSLNDFLEVEQVNEESSSFSQQQYPLHQTRFWLKLLLMMKQRLNKNNYRVVILFFHSLLIVISKQPSCVREREKEFRSKKAFH